MEEYTKNTIDMNQPSPHSQFQRQSHIDDDISPLQVNDLNDSSKRVYTLLERVIMESIGTFFFIFISLATVNQTALSAMIGKYEISQWNIAVGFTIGLSVGVYISGPISGGHLNPAISFTMCLFDDLPFREMIYYILAQMIGGFIASLLVFGLYYNSITLFPYTEATAGLFGTIKASQTSISVGLVEQIIGTALLMIGILFVIHGNPKQPNPWYIGSVLGALSLFLGNNGFAFNMARDLAPRMMSSMFWGVDVFNYGNHWWWVPIVGSFIGAPLGFCTFELFMKYMY